MMTWPLIIGMILFIFPMVVSVSVGCWMLYKELKNEEEWGKIFTGMVISFSLGALSILAYFYWPR